MSIIINTSCACDGLKHSLQPSKTGHDVTRLGILTGPPMLRETLICDAWPARGDEASVFTSNSDELLGS